MKTIKKMKPMSVFFPISRVDDEQRVVEGYAFVNETVPGEGGIRLTRAAMEAATADYIQNGTCREIHQPSAAGKPLDVQWDEKGAYLRMKVVDDQAWKKVKEGVYRGFSVGVTPKVMRGRDVTTCEWWDTSLVDRGKDKDAVFTVWRSGDFDPDAEVEVEVEEAEPVERASFAEYLEECAPSRLRDMALDYLWNALWDIQYGQGEPEEKEAAVRSTCADFTEFMVGAVATGKLPDLKDSTEDEERGDTAPPVITRTMIEAELQATDEMIITRAVWDETQASLETLPELNRRLTEAEGAISTLTTERDETKTELGKVQELCRAAEGRVKELENEPARKPPVRVPTDLERTFNSQPEDQQAADRVKELKGRLDELTRSAPSAKASEGDGRAAEISKIRRELRSYGEVC